MIRTRLSTVKSDSIRQGRHIDVIVNHRNIPPMAAF
jgi:hypothetical protein